MSDTLSIHPLQQRQLDVIMRRLEQVGPIIGAIHRATEHLPAADKIAVLQRIDNISRAQRGTWSVAQRSP